MRADSEQAAGVNITAPAPAGVGSLQAQVRNPTAVRLTWGMAAGASTYNVYRLPDATTPVAPQYWVGATGALDFTDAGLTPATAYVYRVTAVAVGGAESMPSDYVGVRTLARGAPLLLPASQPGPVLYSAVLGWVPLNEGARYRVYGGESMLVATIDLEALRATVDTFYTLVVIPPEVLAGVLLTYGLVPPVGLYQVAELYPDGTESPRSNAMLVAFF
jgi:hypothetical protein